LALLTRPRHTTNQKHNRFFLLSSHGQDSLRILSTRFLRYDTLRYAARKSKRSTNDNKRTTTTTTTLTTPRQLGEDSVKTCRDNTSMSVVRASSQATSWEIKRSPASINQCWSTRCSYNYNLCVIYLFIAMGSTLSYSGRESKDEMTTVQSYLLVIHIPLIVE
jgi:hypothetical protein